ncbi:hypothetical protein D3C85_1653380 [compost metagenome]
MRKWDRFILRAAFANEHLPTEGIRIRHTQGAVAAVDFNVWQLRAAHNIKACHKRCDRSTVEI